jgi:hypothetical protein
MTPPSIDLKGKMMKTAKRNILVTLAAVLLAGALPAAHALNAPKGKVILTVSGKVTEANKDKTAVFDLAMIEALPQKTFTTKTPWDNQAIKFTGPLLRDLLAAVKANGTHLKAVAVNDYKITIPVEDAQKFDMVVAHRMNDQSIPVRTKGPLFIVYPFDSAKELQSGTYYERSIWQLKAIEIE